MLLNVSVSIVNSAGETPKDVARRFGRLACVNLLGGDTGSRQLSLCQLLSCRSDAELIQLRLKTGLYYCNSYIYHMIMRYIL